MELVVLLAVIFLIFLYVMIRGAYEEKQRRKNYREYLRRSFGSFMDESGASAEYFRKRSGKGTDDITWNDLNMEKIFSMMNFTQSSSGADYLYSMLRNPVLSDNDGRFAQMERHIDYMMKNEDKRLDIMLLLNDLGKTGKYSLTDYMGQLDRLGRRTNIKHYAGLILLGVSIALIFENASIGVALLIGTACVNIATYLKEKNFVAPYVTSFAYVMRMKRCADAVINTDCGDDMSDYMELLRDKRDCLKGLEHHSGMVLKMNTSSGNIDEVIFDYAKMMTHIDLIKFNKLLKQVQDNREAIFELTDAIGYIDAIISIGYFRAALPHYCIPELVAGKDAPLTVKDGIHPMIKEPTANSIEQHRGMLVTGSNASGKSTFLKMLAINAMLAQTVHTCAAREYKGGFYRIYSSMALRDDLDNGESYYIVEIKALKRIMDAAASNSGNPLLCFVDEVLRGTNTVERIAASAQILRSLSQSGIYCFAATHDIELTHLLEDCYDNSHFEEDIEGGDVSFSYRLLEGRAHTRNAIKLLEIIGFSDDIIKEADNMAGEFLRSGVWKRG